MLIRELKEILRDFEDDKDVSVFLNLTPNFGIVYEIENWGNNNGHLDLWISDNAKHLISTLNSLDE